MEPQTQNSSLAVPAAIVIAGGLIAVALYFGGAGNSNGGSVSPGTEIKKDVPAVTAEDHIIGNLNAPIKIVEYTDLECPFCKQFHTTMKRVMDEYGQGGQVAWVLRNFPLAQLHPNAPKIAAAAECVAQSGGNGTYWEFVDALFVEAPINTFYDLEKLDDTVASVGVNVADFRTCYDGEKTKEKVEADFNGAVASGGQGTPFNILVLKNKISGSAKQKITALQEQYPGALSIAANGMSIGIAGAQPYEVVKATIDAVIQ